MISVSGLSGQESFPCLFISFHIVVDSEKLLSVVVAHQIVTVYHAPVCASMAIDPNMHTS